LAAERKTHQALEKRLNDFKKNQEKIKKDLETDKQMKVAEEAPRTKRIWKLTSGKLKPWKTRQKPQRKPMTPKPVLMTPRNVHLHRDHLHRNLLLAALGQAAGVVPDAVDKNTNARDTAYPIVAVLDPSLVNDADPIVTPAQGQHGHRDHTPQRYQDGNSNYHLTPQGPPQGAYYCGHCDNQNY
jgi:hypothetical protein